MGLTASEIVKFLSVAEEKGIKGKTLAMMGKQDIHVEWNSFIKTIQELGYKYDEAIAEEIGHHRKIDAYDFFRMFGFLQVHAVDYSGFEGADIIFDLNDDLAENLEGAFDYVINGGTLEHVFDVAKAMKNMSDMVKMGGYIMHIAPAAGWVNHGFYSISPTFFQDYYSANGFGIKMIELEFLMPQRTLYSEDLRLIQSTHELNSYIASVQNATAAERVLLVCVAERKKEITELTYPLQGYYGNIYGENEQHSVSVSSINFEAAARTIKNGQGKQALYGCGHVCELLMNELYRINGEDSVNVIFDSNIAKAGMNYRGVRVAYPVPDKIQTYDKIYICCADYECDIEKILLESGVKTEKIAKMSDFV